MSVPTNSQTVVSSSKNASIFDYLDPLVLKIYIGLYPFREQASYDTLLQMSNSLAFLIRYRTWDPDDAENVSVIGTRTTQGLDVVAVMLQDGAEDARIIASAAGNGEEGSVLRDLHEEVDRLMFQVVEKTEKKAKHYAHLN